MHFIGGFSPTIASYISLKRNNKVKDFKDWLKKVFDIKHNIWTYVLVILFVLIYYVLGCVINGFKFGAPIFMLSLVMSHGLVTNVNKVRCEDESRIHF